MNFLPITKEDLKKRNWDEIDFAVVTGDAYVDHPSFGTAIISRLLESYGFKVGIIAQPNIVKANDFTRFGTPRLGFFVSSGNIDSMVAHYSVSKKRRTEDAYSPGKKAGLRPDRAVIAYTNKIKELFPNSPVIIGGLEASLRRFAHYDYWSDAVRESILFDSGADLLVYGMGERQTREISERLANGEPIHNLTDIKGTCCKLPDITNQKGIRLPSFLQVCEDKMLHAKACKIELDENDYLTGKRLFQEQKNGFLVVNPPMPPLSTEELDKVYALEYMRYYHPIYENQGGVSAIEEVEFSITHNRGCFSGCNFCSLAFHQGRTVSSRSKESVVNEGKLLTNNPRFKGYIHDVGGPTANYRKPSCERQLKSGLCRNKRCLSPTPCDKLEVSHSDYLDILTTLRTLPKVKKVFIRSGIRFDYLIEDKDDAFFGALVKHHTSGQLKVAPEHCSAAVLDKMGKPHIESYKKFATKFFALTKACGKEQYLVPYLMSSHPGSTLKSAIELAVFLKTENIRPEQVQDFYPTPGTISTCMYYTGINPYNMEPITVPKTPHEKALQRALLQYFLPQNRELVTEALKTANRTDLIGTAKTCLIYAPNTAKPKTFTAKNTNKPKRKASDNKWQEKRKR